MQEYKILFTGSVGAGKTTAIAQISDSAPVITDVQNTDNTIVKERTTVGLDYGILTLENGDCLRLFGTPGQQRFDFIWGILAQNALGLIVLIDNSRPDPLSDLSLYLDGFSSQLASMPCVVGVSRLESHPTPSLCDYSAVLATKGYIFPVIAVDTRIKKDVLSLIDTLLALIEVDFFQIAT